MNQTFFSHLIGKTIDPVGFIIFLVLMSLLNFAFAIFSYLIKRDFVTREDFKILQKDIKEEMAAAHQAYASREKLEGAVNLMNEQIKSVRTELGDVKKLLMEILKK